MQFIIKSFGKTVEPERTIVITYRGSDILDAREFKDYYKAQEYVDQTLDTRIVSNNPRVSPIPLKAIDYELVYGSEEIVHVYESEEIVNELAEVKIFEYVGNK